MITISTLSDQKSYDKVDIYLVIKHHSFFVKAAADLFQEEQKAIQLLISTVEDVFISGLNHYHAVNAGKTDMYTMAKSFGRVKISDNMTENVENGYLLMKGGGALTEIFGDKLGLTLNYLAKKTGVKASTAYTYTCLYATVVLKSVGEQANKVNMSPETFVSYLSATDLGLSKIEAAVLFEGETDTAEAINSLAIHQETIIEKASTAGVVKSVFSFVLIVILAVSVYILYKNRSFEYKTSLPSSIQQVKLIGISKS
jgi:hypothetical protein